MKKKLIPVLIICICLAVISYFLINHISGSNKTGGSASYKPGEKNQTGLKIKKYPGNETAFKFVTSEGVKIITDPCYLNEKVYADIVTESHNHEDHTDTSQIKGNYKLINTSGNFDEKGVHITGYPGIHDKGDNWESNIIYVFDIDGIRIAQFASQGGTPDEDTLKKIGKVDILIIQIIDYYTKIGPSEGYQIIKKLNPKIVIPAHGDPNLNPNVAALLKEDAEYDRTGETTVTRKSLDEIKKPKILVLDNGDDLN